MCLFSDSHHFLFTKRDRNQFSDPLSSQINVCFLFFPEKDYLASLMFSYYDKNMDNTIVRDEIWEIWVTEPFQRMFASCTLMDMFRFENILDDEIQEGEFLKAFGKCKPC